MMSRRQNQTRGYILIEAVMSMALLSLGLVAIQGAIRQTIIVRGQARDYTQARFLIEETLARLEIESNDSGQPQLVEGSQSGDFEGDFSRFAWKWTISRAYVPPPPIPPDIPPEEAEAFRLSVNYVVKVEVTVSWKRGDNSYEETFETLWPPEKLWVPPPEIPSP